MACREEVKSIASLLSMVDDSRRLSLPLDSTIINSSSNTVSTSNPGSVFEAQQLRSAPNKKRAQEWLEAKNAHVDRDALPSSSQVGLPPASSSQLDSNGGRLVYWWRQLQVHVYICKGNQCLYIIEVWSFDNAFWD